MYFDKQFFMFGGDQGGQTGRIAAYSPATDTWTEVGTLQSPRFEHTVIWSVDSFLVVGGSVQGQGQSDSVTLIIF